MKLLIVETIERSEAIKQHLDLSWKVAISGRDICWLPKDRLAIDLAHFEPEYQLSAVGEQIIIELRGLAKKADAVYLGMSNNNNGEALAAHIQEYLGHANIKRVELPEAITAKNLQLALDNVRRVDYRKVDIVLIENATNRLLDFATSLALQNDSLKIAEVKPIKLLKVREHIINLVAKGMHYDQAIKEFYIKVQQELGITYKINVAQNG